MYIFHPFCVTDCTRCPQQTAQYESIHAIYIALISNVFWYICHCHSSSCYIFVCVRSLCTHVFNIRYKMFLYIQIIHSFRTSLVFTCIFASSSSSNAWKMRKVTNQVYSGYLPLNCLMGEDPRVTRWRFDPKFEDF